jgi:hypothetical protein
VADLAHCNESEPGVIELMPWYASSAAVQASSTSAIA